MLRQPIAAADVDDVLPPRVKTELLVIYNDMEKDEDGQTLLNEKEVKRFLEVLGVQFTDEEVKDIVREADEDSSGTIDEVEFLVMMARLMHDANVEDEIVEAYRVLDTTGTGRLALHVMCAELAEDSAGELSGDDARDLLIRERCVDESGAVNYVKFIRRMMNK